MCTQYCLIEHFPRKTCDFKSDCWITEPSREWEAPMLTTRSNLRVTLQVLQYILVNSLDNPSDNCEIALSHPCRGTVRHIPTARAERSQVCDFQVWKVSGNEQCCFSWGSNKQKIGNPSISIMGKGTSFSVLCFTCVQCVRVHTSWQRS